MSSCKGAEKPIISYTFGNGQSRKYQATQSPIDVTTGTVPIATTSNYSLQGYQISFASPQAQFGTLTITVIDYQVLFYAGGNEFDPYRGYYIAVIPCGSTAFGKNSPAKGIPYDISGLAVIRMDAATVTVNNNIHCPSSNLNRCTIQISANGILLFQDQGNCPVKYDIQCGNCPEGYLQGSKSIYPGYCCVECSSLEGSIIQMINQIKSLS